MQNTRAYRRIKVIALLIVILLSLYSIPTVVIAQTNWSLYGWDLTQTKWDSGNVKGYKEGDNVPFMLSSKKFSDVGPNWTVVLDYMDGDVVGYDEASNWFIGSIADSDKSISEITKLYEPGIETFTISTAKIVKESSLSTIQYTMTPAPKFLETLTAAEDWALYWTSHLSKTGTDDRAVDGVSTIAKGSGYWKGASLHVKFYPDSGHMDVPVSVPKTPNMPSIEVTKVADKESVPDTGDDVTFTISVKNTGDVNVTLESLTDDIYGNIAIANPANTKILGTTLLLPQTIEPGISYTGTFTATVSGTAGSTHTNTVTASASYAGKTITAEGSESIEIAGDILPDVSVTKTASVVSVPETGGTVQFTVVIQNNASEIAYIDSVLDQINGGGYAVIAWDSTPGAPPASLAGNSSWTGTFTREISGSYPDSDTDTVQIIVHDPENNQDTATDDATVALTEVTQEEPAPTVTLDKSVDVTEKNAPGGDFKYTLTITNTSDSPVTIDSLTDTYQDLSEYVGDVIAENSQLIIDYTVPHTGTGTYINTASVTVSANGKTATADDTQTVSVVDNSVPSVSLDKTVDDTSKVAPGGTFNYTVTITNTSNAPVVITSLTDTYNAAIFSGLTEDQKALDKDEVLEIKYEVKHEAVDSYENTASVTVTARNQKTATASDRVTVVVYDEEDPIPPTVTLVKTVDDTSKVAPGGIFNYTVTITNASAFPVTITELSDSVTDLSQYLGEGDEVLVAGASLIIEYPVTHTGVGTYVNTASVEVTADNELTAVDEDSITVTVTPASDDDDDDDDDGGGGTTTTPVVESAELPFLEVHAGEIPQTGDNGNVPFAYGGLLFLILSGFGLYGWFRKEQKESES